MKTTVTQGTASSSFQLSPATKQAMLAAWNLFRQGLIPDAEAIAHELLQKSPNFADAWHLLGAIYLQQSRPREAVVHILKAIQLEGKNPEYYNNLGLAYHEQGQLALAVKQYLRAVNLAPNYADALYNLHAAQLKPDQLSASIKHLERVLMINPRDFDAVFMLAVLLEYEGEVELAAQYFDKLKYAERLFQARLDAWQYMKSANEQLPPIMGSGMQTFTYAMQLAEVNGLVLEFGVRFGNSIHMISALANQHVHGFDSFEGLPDEWHHEPKGSYTTKGVIPNVPDNVSLHVGWFEDTLPKFLAGFDQPVRFINVDCDIYSSTKTIFTLLAARIVVGTVIVFDEYIGNAHWREDEYKAFQEAVHDYGWEYRYISISFFTKQVAVIITSIE